MVDLENIHMNGYFEIEIEDFEKILKIFIQ